MLEPVWKRKDKKASVIIITFSIIVFVAVVLLNRVKLEVDLGFDVHLFALINAMLNSTVAILLIAALVAVKKKHYEIHKRIMLTAMTLSVLFLISYVCHHLFAGDTVYGDLDQDGVLSDLERAQGHLHGDAAYQHRGCRIPEYRWHFNIAPAYQIALHDEGAG